MKLFDTTLPQNYSKGLFDEKGYDLSETHTDKILYSVFTATSNLLNNAKSKDHPTSFEFATFDGKFVAAAIVQFFENEDPTKPGNWSLVWTFNESDIPAGTNRIYLKNPDTHNYFRAAAGEKYGIRFKDASCLIILHTYVFEQLYKWLDENAEEGKEISVELDSIFQARVAIENGEKVFALEPAGEIKMLIKDDAAIEK